MQKNTIDSPAPGVRRRLPPQDAPVRPGADIDAAVAPPARPVSDTVLDRLPATQPTGDMSVCEWFTACLGFESGYRQALNLQYDALLEQCAAMPATVDHAPWLQARLNHLIRDLTFLNEGYIELSERPRFMALVLQMQVTARKLTLDLVDHTRRATEAASLHDEPLRFATATGPAAVWAPPALPDVEPPPIGVKAPKRHTLADPRHAVPRIHRPDRAAAPPGFVLTPAHETRLRDAIDLALERENGKMLLTDRDMISMGHAIAAVAGGKFPATSNDPRYRRHTPESTIASATERMTEHHREVIRAFASAYLAERRDD